MTSMDWCGDKNTWYKECAKCKRPFYVKGDEETAGKLMRDYFAADNHAHDRLRAWCRDCSNHARTGREDNGIPTEEMLKAQGGKCKLCPTKLTLKTAKVDHCHKTKKIRDVLCNTCNVRMGGVDADSWLIRATAYRDRWRAIHKKPT
jgi:Recombination endonuclease VII